MYSYKIGVTFFGITVLFAVSYQYEPELLPPPEPRDPPDKAKFYRDKKMLTYHEKMDSSTRLWACASGWVLYMRWPDRVNRPNQSDLWFDRLVYIHHEGNYDYVLREYTDHPSLDRKERLSDLSVSVNGVIIEPDRILTSYNPFRQIIKFAFKRQFTHVCALQERRMGKNDNDSSTVFRTTYHPISCARQVVPLEETKDMPLNLWHGRAHKSDYMRQHSPLHDLMVIRIEGYIPDMTKNNYDFEFFRQQTDYFYKHGPQLSILAKQDDIMGSDFKFAMMGHIFHRDPIKEEFKDIFHQFTTEYKEEVKRMRDTYVGYYSKSDNVLVDCDEWIPREWGHFICVLNKQKLRRLASGAALYSRGLLFGIGSFTLFKGDQSIIVFTDVRPYESLITNNETGPCTTTDQFGSPAARSPGKPPSTQENEQTNSRIPEKN